MALIVEDGTGLSDANAYCDVAFADDYHSVRGNDDWQATDDQKEQVIIKATDYIELRYGLIFKGSRLVPGTQALFFPRENLYDSDGTLIEGIPAALKKATAEYALRALSAALMPDPTIDESSMLLTSIEEDVGPIKEAKKFNARLGIISLRPYPSADRLLMEYLRSSGGAIRG